MSSNVELLAPDSLFVEPAGYIFTDEQLGAIAELLIDDYFRHLDAEGGITDGQ